MDNEKIIRDFVQAWSRLDPEEHSSYFTNDGVYHNMPTGPVAGRENVQKMITPNEARLPQRFYEVFFERRPDVLPLFGVHSPAEREDMILETPRSVLAFLERESWLEAVCSWRCVGGPSCGSS